jgi:hypothetical protein
MMTIAPYDHYAEARAIAATLKARGDEQIAREILAAISNGVSGTEIFMELRALLSPLSTKGLENSMAFRLVRLRRELDLALL